MKAKDFGDFLETFAKMLDAAGAGQQASGWRTLLKIFEAKPAVNVADICKALASLQRPDTGTGAPVRLLINLVPAIESCFGKHAKKSLIDDLKRVASALAPFADVSIQAYADAAVTHISVPAKPKRPPAQPKVPTAELVQRYKHDLQAALNDEARFSEIFSGLKRDKAIKTDEAKQLARAFTGVNPKSKGDALELIWGRHAAIVGAGARARATGDRTAA